MSLTIISVDTGNKNIKTPNTQPFNSGLICHGTSAPPLSVETLRYDGKYYSLTEKRIPTMFDKTETEDFYILTLFAAAKEIAAQDGPKPAYRKDICLALGLPPTHLQELKPKYLKYFGRGGQRIEFTYNGTHYDLRVARVEVFPQGYAAVVPYLGKIRDKTRSYIIDIGGYTTDVVMLKKGGEPDLDFCESFNAGVIRMRKMREKTTQGGVTAEKKKDGVPISYWSAALNMLAWKAGLSYGKIQVWAQFHPEEYGKWMHELRLSYEKAAEDGTLKDGIVTLPSYMPESLPRRATPLPHGWSTEKHIIGK